MNNLYSIEVEKPNGEMQSLKEFEGKPLIIVNTASKCGFTPQFAELQQLYENYNQQGLEVLGFPSAQFNSQEFDNQEETMTFCQKNYGVTFPMFATTEVKGPSANLLFKFLTSEQKGLLTGTIKWNFTKFLVDREGKVVKRYAPQTSPEKIEEDLKKLL
ncbi:glutathione peroxidase [Planococcus lenghuensis]|uniref:Glutathione peroxidase n=1 Tax=Planococcus lenghuensis TaxID=2213202 RepID=A0A1Q2KU84_9BACL|nr:glutathione peroxidase [Planococcus lenghuensis]AQQ51684.1 glutathione peroxidase [Planococcus lenghuensis]